MSWRDEAACTSSRLGLWFEEDQAHKVETARSICARCPSRMECFWEAMQVEKGSAVEIRHGVYAGTTPGQRWSIERRGVARCKGCQERLDPIEVVEGRARCSGCGRGVAGGAIPDEGDRWTKRHTTLARRAVAWFHENLQPGDPAPAAGTLARIVGARGRDMRRVYDAFLSDGTLSRRKNPGSSLVYNGGRGHTPWLPPHLSESDQGSS